MMILFSSYEVEKTINALKYYIEILKYEENRYTVDDPRQSDYHDMLLQDIKDCDRIIKKFEGHNKGRICYIMLYKYDLSIIIRAIFSFNKNLSKVLKKSNKIDEYEYFSKLIITYNKIYVTLWRCYND